MAQRNEGKNTTSRSLDPVPFLGGHGDSGSAVSSRARPLASCSHHVDDKGQKLAQFLFPCYHVHRLDRRVTAHSLARTRLRCDRLQTIRLYVRVDLAT